MQRLCELTDEKLIREIDDDAVAREVAKRFFNYQHRVSAEVERLENQILKLKGVL